MAQLCKLQAESVHFLEQVRAEEGEGGGGGSRGRRWVNDRGKAGGKGG